MNGSDAYSWVGVFDEGNEGLMGSEFIEQSQALDGVSPPMGIGVVQLLESYFNSPIAKTMGGLEGRPRRSALDAAGAKIVF